MKKVISVILCCLTMLYCGIMISSAKNISTDSQTIAIFKLTEVETQQGEAKMVIQNKETGEKYDVHLKGEDKWQVEYPLPSGTYKILSLKTTKGQSSLSLVKTAGVNFKIDNTTYTEVMIPVTEFVHLTNPKTFLSNNFLALLLIFGSGTGLLVVKSKRDKGEA